MYVRSRYLCVVAAMSDAALLFGGPPLQYLSWSTARLSDPPTSTVLLVLAANVALFILLTAGMVSSLVLARRGIRLAFRRASRSSVRPSRV